MTKINHNAENLPESFGVDTDKFKEIMIRVVDAFNNSRQTDDENEVIPKSVTFEQCVRTWRDASLGECNTEISAYELGLFVVAVEIGMDIVKSTVGSLADESVTMIKMLKSAGVPDNMLLDSSIKVFEQLVKEYSGEVEGEDK